jgi:penicillin-binding protein activator
MRNHVVALLLSVVLLPLVTGCAAFRGSIREKSPAESGPLTAHYDQNDLLQWAQIMADAILTHPFPAPGEGQPIVAELGIQNRTSTHIDTLALANTLTTRLLDSGKMRFVNTQQRDTLLKEQGYVLANCTEETRVKVGRQLGAKYILTGSLSEITTHSPRQVRVSKQEDVYYQLTVEITDLETGLIVLRKQKDRLREASKPLIGW